MISGGAKVLTLVGHPVAQAVSLAVVNERLAARGLDAVMVPLDVLPTGFADAVEGLSAVENWAGSLVTMPYRQSVVPLLATRSPTVSKIGACNMVRPGPLGLAGDMLDGVAMCAAIQQAGGDIAASAVGLVGAGSVASAIAFALAARGAQRIAISSRSPERASQLAIRVRTDNPWTSVVVTPDLTDCDLIVNATPRGTRRGDALPLSAKAVYSACLVADAVITHVDSPLIGLAKTAGVKTVRGIDILASQMDLFIDFVLGDALDDHGSSGYGPWQEAHSEEREVALVAD